LYAFYDERLPAGVTNAAALESWLKKEPEAEQTLRISREQLLLRDPGTIEDQFPDRLDWDGQSYCLSYEFTPGKEGDGVSLTIPVALLNRLPRFRLEWMVPGLLREKCIALVKGLPKATRRQLVPVPDWVDRALARLEVADAPLLDALAECLAQLGGPRIDPTDWRPEDLDDYYRMNLRIVDERGRLLAQGRDVDALIEEYRDATRKQVADGDPASPARRGLTAWDFDALPAEHHFRQAGVAIVAFPALVDRGEHVDIVLHDYPGDAHAEQRRGLARLLMLANRPLIRDLRKRFMRGNAATLLFATLELNRDELLDTLLPALVLEAAGIGFGDCRDREGFEAARQRLNRQAVSVANDAERWLSQGMEAMAGAFRLLASHREPYAEARADLTAQRNRLLRCDAFLSRDFETLRHYPRYGRAMLTRVERLPANYRRDQEHQETLAGLRSPLADLLENVPRAQEIAPSAREYAAMLEEFRVSLFAQHLGTSRPVSAKRLRAQWQAVDDWFTHSAGRQLER